MLRCARASEPVLGRRPGARLRPWLGYTENTVVHHALLDAGVNFLPKPWRSGSATTTSDRIAFLTRLNLTEANLKKEDSSVRGRVCARDISYYRGLVLAGARLYSQLL